MTTKFPIALSPEVVKAFRSQGFVVTPDVLTEEEVRQYGTAIDQAVAVRTASDTRAVTDKSTYEQSFLQCMRLCETDPGVVSLTFHEGLAGIAAQLLGVPSVNLWQDQALFKEPGGRETTAHQDQPFWPIGQAPLISAWIPLNAVHEGNGAMAYVPGSHLVGPLKVVDITHTSEPFDILNDPALAGEPLRVVPVNPGSVIWHHGFTVHGAGANRSDSVRRAFTVVYLSADATRTKAWPTFPLDRAGVGVGDRIEGEGLPRLWPPLAARPAPPVQKGAGTGPQGL